MKRESDASQTPARGKEETETLETEKPWMTPEMAVKAQLDSWKVAGPPAEMETKQSRPPLPPTPKPLEQAVGRIAPAVVTQSASLAQTPTLELGPVEGLRLAMKETGERGLSMYKDPFSVDITAIKKEPESVEPCRRTLLWTSGPPEATVAKAQTLACEDIDEARRTFFGFDENFEEYQTRAFLCTRDSQGDMLPGVDQGFLRIIRGLWAHYQRSDLTPTNVEAAMREICSFTKQIGPSTEEMADPASGLVFDVFGLGKLACTVSPRFHEAFRRPLPGLHGVALERARMC